MSLAQKYTWADFLKAKPEFKGKRTTDEGKKAFEAAFKSHVKGYLKDRATSEQKAHDVLVTKKTKLVETLKKAKTGAKAKIVRAKVGRKEAAIVKMSKRIEKTKTVQKSF